MIRFRASACAVAPAAFCTFAIWFKLFFSRVSSAIRRSSSALTGTTTFPVSTIFRAYSDRVIFPLFARSCKVCICAEVTRNRTVLDCLAASVLGGLPPRVCRFSAIRKPLPVSRMAAGPTEARSGEVVTRRRRRLESQIPCDRRERGMLCRATLKGSAANGIAPQGKVVRSGRKKSRKGVFVAREHNLASYGFGSVRCRGRGPAHGTQSLPRKPRRQRSAVARGDACGTCRIDAHARAGTECLSDSVMERAPGVVGKGRAAGYSARSRESIGETDVFCFHDRR